MGLSYETNQGECILFSEGRVATTTNQGECILFSEGRVAATKQIKVVYIIEGGEGRSY